MAGVVGISLEIGGVIGTFEPFEDSLQLTRHPGIYRLALPGTVLLKPMGYDLARINGRLTLTPGDGLVAPNLYTTPPSFVLRAAQGQENGTQVTLNVDLDERLLDAYELHRLRVNGSPSLDFTIGVQAIGGGRPYAGGTMLYVRPAVSRWADLLIRAGYTPANDAQRLDMSAFGNDARMAPVLEGFRQAERHVIEGRPHEAVGHCRIVLDSFARLAGDHAAFDNNFLNRLLRGADREKVRRLRRPIDGLYDIVNDAHHPRPAAGSTASSGSLVSYDPDEARYVLTIAAATLRLVGRQRLPRTSAP